MNKLLIEQFQHLVNNTKYDIENGLKKDKLKNMFRLKSNEYVLNVLKKFPYEITNSNQLKNIKNVGKKSLEKINEILKNGKLKNVKDDMEILNYNKSLNELEEIIGIGRKKAHILYTKYHISNINELKKAYKEGKIELDDMTIKGLEYYDKIKENIPHDDITKFWYILLKYGLKISPMLIISVCGSYRRMTKTSNDIDIILSSYDHINYLHSFVKMLYKDKILTVPLTNMETKTKHMSIGLIEGVYRRIDIRFLPIESYHYGVLYFTGSKEFNKKNEIISNVSRYEIK